MEDSPHSVWDKLRHEGFWRLLTIRTFSTQEGNHLLILNKAMAIVQVSPKGLSDEEIQKEKQRVIEFCQKGVDKDDISLTSVFWETNTSISNANADKQELLWGVEAVHEQLLDLK